MSAKGLQASGKSQTAKGLTRFFPREVKIEVDKLRQMVISVDWTNQAEHINLLEMSARLAYDFLKLNLKPVIVVDTFSGDKIKNFLASLKQLDASLRISLGDLYMKGEGVPIDFVESAKWYRRAANQGVAQAQHNLAGMYFTGFAIKKNYVEAYKWYSLAAAHGQTESKAMIDQVMCLMTKDQISEGDKAVQSFVPKLEIKYDLGH